MTRVVITGAGTVNALGPNVAETCAAFRQGRSAIRPLGPGFGDAAALMPGARATAFDPAAHFAAQRLPALDRFAQFALVAAREAIAASRLDLSGALAGQAGVVVGTASGGLETVDENFRKVYAEGRRRVPPLTVPRLMHSAAASQISMEWHLGGPVMSASSACASSNHAIALAAQLVRGGVAPVMIAGGADAMLTPGGVWAWQALRILSPDGCRPFASDRNGTVLGEGAGLFVLETLDGARARGAPILAEIAGLSMCADGGDLLASSQEGAERAMRAALADAGIAPGAVGYINAHGTGTSLNDATEARAIAAVFGPDGPPVSSTKGAHGHAVGATGAIELLACLMALGEGILPPTAGTGALADDCPIRLILGAPMRQGTGAVLSNAFGFGGLNACLVLTAP